MKSMMTMKSLLLVTALTASCDMGADVGSDEKTPENVVLTETTHEGNAALTLRQEGTGQTFNAALPISAKLTRLADGAVKLTINSKKYPEHGSYSCTLSVDAADPKHWIVKPSSPCVIYVAHSLEGGTITPTGGTITLADIEASIHVTGRVSALQFDLPFDVTFTGTP